MRAHRQHWLRPGVIFVALLSTLAARPAQAQEQAAACRLHLWPSAGLKVQAQVAGEYFGNIYWSNVNEDGKSNWAVDSKLPLNTGEQLRILRGTEVPPLLGLQNFAVASHDEALTSTALRTTQGRYANEDQAICYAELVISDVVLSDEYMRGASLRMFVRFRQFDAGSTATRTLGTWVQAKVPTHKNMTLEELKVTLDGAFVEGLKSFGGFLQKPRKTR